jgi:hypothetical protein
MAGRWTEKAAPGGDVSTGPGALTGNGVRPMSNHPTPAAIYLWAAFGSPSSPPDRLEVASCDRCAAVVPTAGADTHYRWHRALSRSNDDTRS